MAEQQGSSQPQRPCTFVARCASSSSSSASTSTAAALSRFGPSYPGATLAGSSMLNAMLYPGDTAVITAVLDADGHVGSENAIHELRSTAATVSARLLRKAVVAPIFVNQTLPADDDDSDSEEEESKNADQNIESHQHVPAPDEILLPPSVFSDLRIEEGSTVSLVPLEPPTATVVVLAALPSSPEATALRPTAAQRLLRPYFGVAGQEEELRASALVEAVAAVRAGDAEEAVAAALGRIAGHAGSAGADSLHGDQQEPNGGASSSNAAASNDAGSGGDKLFETVGPGRLRVPIAYNTVHEISDAATNASHSYSSTVHDTIPQAELSWLQSHMRQANCKFIPVSIGTTVAVPLQVPPRQQQRASSRATDGRAAAEDQGGQSHGQHPGANQDQLSNSAAAGDALRIAREGYPAGSGYAAFRVIETQPAALAVVVGPDTRITVVAT